MRNYRVYLPAYSQIIQARDEDEAIALFDAIVEELESSFSIGEMEPVAEVISALPENPGGSNVTS